MLPSQLGEEGERFVDSITRTQLEQELLLDYLTIRLFRRTLLCRSDVALDREIDHRVLADGWIGADVKLDADVTEAQLLNTDELTFTDADGLRISSDDPVSKVMLHALATAGPAGISTSDAVAHVAQLTGRDDDTLTDEVTARAMRILVQGRLDAGRWKRPVVGTPPERPTTSRLVRHQVTAGLSSVVNARQEHRSVDALDRVLLGAMDGTRDANALAQAVLEARDAGVLSLESSDGPVDDAAALATLVADRLATLAASGLVLDPTRV
jgi:methyltransferase-like protein